MTAHKNSPSASSNTIRYAIIGMLAVAAFFGAYKFASAGSVGGSAQALSPATSAQGGASSSAAAGGCCGGGGASGGCCGSGSAAAVAPVVGTAQLSDGVQKIFVDVKLQYSPNVIHLKAGVPTEITFSSAQGCTGVVQSQDLGFEEDLTSGSKTVKLDGLKPGTYGFSCGMNMIQGHVVVE